MDLRNKIIPLAIGVFFLLAFLLLGGYLFYQTTISSASKTAKSKIGTQANRQNPELPTPTPSVTPAPQIQSNEIPLTIIAPENRSVSDTKTLVVSGRTSGSAEISVNETDTKAGVNGMFSVTITLDEGENPIIITAVDSEGKAAEQEIEVTSNPDA